VLDGRTREIENTPCLVERVFVANRRDVEHEEKRSASRPRRSWAVEPQSYGMPGTRLVAARRRRASAAPLDVTALVPALGEKPASCPFFGIGIGMCQDRLGHARIEGDAENRHGDFL